MEAAELPQQVPKRHIGETDPTELGGPAKRRLLSDNQLKEHFRADLFDDTTVSKHRQAYVAGEPFKHHVIENILDPKLLRNVRDEAMSSISFTQKETDIYRIWQSGDLANLDGLGDEDLRHLPHLVTLRSVLFSLPFRKYLSQVTGCGPLSGSKTDMSINVYDPSCHLLCHDDVIGSRRVSFILYLTDPDKPWQEHWGGGLRLYPTEVVRVEGESEKRVPTSTPSRIIPPAFNQLAFFEVQPGKSFHDVQEVIARRQNDKFEDDAGRKRMAISGWFHLPQHSEEGYEEGAEERLAKESSLAQLLATTDPYDLPRPNWMSREDVDSLSDEEMDIDLTGEEFHLLRKYITDDFLDDDGMEKMFKIMRRDGYVELPKFLRKDCSRRAFRQMKRAEADPTQQFTKELARPPHKHYFKYREAVPKPLSKPGLDPNEGIVETDLIDKLLPSRAFRKWLSSATGLSLGNCKVMGRRFPKGWGYTLGTNSEEDGPTLQVTLCLTPTIGWGDKDADKYIRTLEAAVAKEDGKPVEQQAEPPQAVEDQMGSVGGFETYMVSAENATQANGDANGDANAEANGHEKGENDEGGLVNTLNLKPKVDPAVYESNDDGMLVHVNLAPNFNNLTLTIRDKGFQKFVKYVSSSAPGDRWDIVGEWKIRGVIFDDSDDEGIGAPWSETDEEGEEDDDDNSGENDEESEEDDDEEDDEEEEEEGEDDDDDASELDLYPGINFGVGTDEYRVEDAGGGSGLEHRETADKEAS